MWILVLFYFIIISSTTLDTSIIKRVLFHLPCRFRYGKSRLLVKDLQTNLNQFKHTYTKKQKHTHVFKPNNSKKWRVVGVIKKL